MTRQVLLVAVFAAAILSSVVTTEASAQSFSEPGRLHLRSVKADSPADLARDAVEWRLPTLSMATRQDSAKEDGGDSVLLRSLYASTAVLQALDVHSTRRAFSHGGVEANPLMRGVSRNTAGFIALKAGITAGTIVAARNMAKHNQAAAVATLIGISAAHAFIVSRNYQIERHP